MEKQKYSANKKLIPGKNQQVKQHVGLNLYGIWNTQGPGCQYPKYFISFCFEFVHTKSDFGNES